ncbi:MAG: hypothetical protein AABX51_08635 [Nanoarchaeota archaeon]|mgnify:CR=1 FL=1
MVNAKILVFLIVFMLAMNVSHSFQTNSSNYKNFPLIVSSGGDIVNSSAYKTYTATGIVAGVINSSTYKNLLGFFYTWLLANGQACTANNQCEGGFCCSNLCQSTACTTPPEPGPVPSGGGGGAPSGGGGGGAIITQEEEEKGFSVSPSSVKTKIILGGSSQQTLTIRNTGDVALTVSLSVEGVKDYLFLSDNILTLDPAQAADVTLNFIGKKVGGFAGRILARADEIEKEIPVIIESITEKVLFDAKLDIPAAYAVVNPGGTLKSQITLLNIGAPEKVDVIATYLIKDLRGNIIYQETETFAIEKQASFAKSFKLPKSLEEGSYVAIMEVRYADSFAVSSQLFEVKEKKSIVEQIVARDTASTMAIALVLIAFVIIMLLRFIPTRKRRQER